MKAKEKSHQLKRSRWDSFWQNWSKEEKLELKILLALSLLLYLVLGWAYPTAHITTDSGDYVYCAINNTFGGFRPMGYSWFLRFVHFFSEKLAVTIAAQFLLHIIATGYFLFTVRRFFPPAKIWLYRVFALLVFLNIPAISMTTWLLSDSINASFLLFSVAFFLRLLEKPGQWQVLIFWLAALFFLCKVRYASLACIPAFMLALIIVFRFREKTWIHLTGLCAVSVLVWFHNVSENEKEFGEKTFSAFGGWVKANNASSMLPHIQAGANDWEDPETKQAFGFIRKFDDSCFSEEKILRTDFMWNPRGPGKSYFILMRKLNGPQGESYAKTWVHTGCIYDQYASQLIRKNPGAYARYFLWPNFKRLLHPYNDLTPFNKAAVPPECTEWFGLSYGTFYVKHDFLYPLNRFAYSFYRVLVFLFLPLLLLCFFLRKRLGWIAGETRTLLALTIILLTLFLFLVWGHPVMYRYVGWQSVFLLVPVYAFLNAWLRRRAEQKRD